MYPTHIEAKVPKNTKQVYDQFIVSVPLSQTWQSTEWTTSLLLFSSILLRIQYLANGQLNLFYLIFFHIYRFVSYRSVLVKRKYLVLILRNN